MVASPICERRSHTEENESHLANHDNRKLQRQPTLEHMDLHICSPQDNTQHYLDETTIIQVHKKGMKGSPGREGEMMSSNEKCCGPKTIILPRHLKVRKETEHDTGQAK
jgi:hypothetical protein